MGVLVRKGQGPGGIECEERAYGIKIQGTEERWSEGTEVRRRRGADEMHSRRRATLEVLGNGGPDAQRHQLKTFQA